MPVKVTARQWSWLFEYPNGKQDSVLRVPLHKPVKLLLTSADVLHSLYIPAYRIKEDCVPGMNTYLWFQPDTPGSYDLFCTEYCGVAHADMITKVEVMPREDFDAWYTEAAVAPERPVPPEKKAPRPDIEALLNVKGCLACHSTDGTPKIGPTFKGAYGRTVTVVTAGKERELVADDEYLKKSLLDPQADIVKGFPPIMPSQKGLLTDKELEDIIGYLKTLK
jgi:cytochrome c oxidase subunit 2